MNYRERTQEDLTIWRSNGGAVQERVPITVGSTRKFSLMSEDSITLVFSLPLLEGQFKPVHFMVGDYIIDELFGKFFIREEQMPRYNTSTGGWDYQLRFDADYWLAENHIFMLTTGGNEPRENDDIWSITGTFIRKETTWNLTGTLLDHALMILRNYKALGLRRNVGETFKDVQLCIDPTATHAGESKHLSYDGVHIITALTQIANEFECEWWFEDNVLHFGKCGGEGETEFDFLIGNHELGAGNVENMEISRNQNTYANRLFVLGSTKNIPDSYGKKLMLDVTRNSDGSYIDSVRKINPYTMLKDEGTKVADFVYMLTPLTAHNQTSDDIVDNTIKKGGISSKTTFKFRSVAKRVGGDDMTFSVRKDTYADLSSFTSGIRFSVSANHGTIALTIQLRLFLENVSDTTEKIYLSDNPRILTTTVTNLPTNEQISEPVYDLCNVNSVYLKAGKTYKLVLEGVVDFNKTVGWAYGGETDYIMVSDHSAPCTITIPAGKCFVARVKWNDNIYPIVFNQSGEAEGEQNSYNFKFVETPSGFGNYETVELLDYDPLQIPFSYWTEDYDNPSSMLSLGERRLHLPLDGCPQGYVEKNDLTDEQRVEELVRAEDIYPRCYLRVTNVETEDRDAYTEYADGTKWNWPWKAYIVTVEQLDGTPFPFKRKYVKEGEKLQAVFLSEMDTDRAYDEMLVPLPSNTGEKLLAGMTYDIGFTEKTKASDNTYTLIRNNDYGTMLPNDTLCPTVGDLLVLIGWDVRAMDDLQLIDKAEGILYRWANDYLDAIEEGQWTFTCHMMSDWPFILYGEHQYDSEQFIESEGKPFDDSEQRDVYVRLGKNKYGYVPFKTEDAKWFFEQNGQFYVRNTEYYILPTEGARVRILHEALKGGQKESRIIGYELKLDKPYDSPTYTVGETDAYSRIKQLEKKLNTK